MVQAGEMLSSGRGVAAPDMKGAVALFTKATDLNDAGGMIRLAECLLDGKGTKKDPARAVALLTTASAMGNPVAMSNLGSLYKKGVRGALPPDPAEAFRLFSKAADLGWVDAQGNLGVLYLLGIGTAKDEQKAVELFKDGANKGNVLCMYFYAGCLDGGVGVPHDEPEAQSWFIKAAAGGNTAAIGWCQEHQVPFTVSH
jgi:TPR repeat protein